MGRITSNGIKVPVSNHVGDANFLSAKATSTKPLPPNDTAALFNEQNKNRTMKTRIENSIGNGLDRVG
jgi:hypothetical protein